MLRPFLEPQSDSSSRKNQSMTLRTPPTAQRRPYQQSFHGVTLEDPYHWLQDPNYPTVDDPDVLDYLKAENAYFDDWYAPHQDLTQTLFQELKAREQDESVPYTENGYRYR